MIFRKHIRLKDYDYSINGYYFVTICCSCRAKLCSEYREIIEKHLKNLENHENVKLDYFKITPNHLHFILVLEEAKLSLCRYIQDFKSKTTLEIKKNNFVGKRFWQLNYYEHIIRNEKVLDEIRKYIDNNTDVEKPNWEELDK
ncbi:MAG: transposase [Elusimicrobia bacterium]|nr:transposase [Elusimicrobiota bacterium]